MNVGATGFDFAAGGNRLDLSVFGFADLAAVVNDTEVVGDDAIIHLGDDDMAILVDTDPASLHEDNLLLV
jgi:hypothetical protein